MKKGILFDLDGTLWDSSKAVVDSWNEILTGMEDDIDLLTYDQMKGYMGKTMEEIAYLAFPRVEKERALAILKKCELYENEYISTHGGVLMPDL